jgi:hypothetical protein
MSRADQNTRRVAIAKLRIAIDATDDPALLISLSNSLSKLKGRPKGRHNHNHPAKPVKPESTYRAVNYPNQSHCLDKLEMGEQTSRRMVFDYERLNYYAATDAEKADIRAQVAAGFSPAELQAFDVYRTDHANDGSYAHGDPHVMTIARAMARGLELNLN